MTLRNGLYDRLVYEEELDGLNRLIAEGRASVETPTTNQRREQLVTELVDAIPQLLDHATSGEPDKAAQARIEIALISEMLKKLRGERALHYPRIASPPQILKSVHPPHAKIAFPSTGLRRPWLFTSAKADPSLLTELRSELNAVDRVDILVSFITWSGVRKLLDVLSTITALDALGNSKTTFRILTTTYIGATEARAVDALAKLPGVQLRISLGGRRTRLHAKAWIFHRESQFGTAFVGSANLSEAALIGGIEWTVKFTQKVDPTLFGVASANFETLWNDPEFQKYDPLNPVHRDSLARALEQERGSKSGPVNLIAVQTWFDLRPKAYQQEMLDRLEMDSHEGDRPISIVWRLEAPMSAELFRRLSILRC